MSMYNNQYTWHNDGSVVSSSLWSSGCFCFILNTNKNLFELNFSGSPSWNSTCAVLNYQTRFLDDMGCGSIVSIICKRPLTTTVAPLITSVSNCPLGWLFYGNSCYKLFQTALEFSQAQSFCSQQARGSYLIEINSDGEYSYIKSSVFNTLTNVTAWVSLIKMNFIIHLLI